MKKLLKILSAFALGMTLWTGCGSVEGSPDVEPGYLGETPKYLIDASAVAKRADPNNEKVVLIYSREDKKYTDWGLWIWADDGSGLDSDFTISKGKFKKDSLTGYGYMILDDIDFSSSVKSLIESTEPINFIIRNSSWGKAPDGDCKIIRTDESKHFLVMEDSTTVYNVVENPEPTMVAALSETTTTIEVALNTDFGLQTSASSNGFIVVDEDDNIIQVIDAVNSENRSDRFSNDATKVLIKLANPMDTSKSYYVKNEKFSPSSGVGVVMIGAIKSGLLEKNVPLDELGIKINGSTASFATWAPTASSVSLLLYNDWNDVIAVEQSPVIKPMTFDVNTGKWFINDVDVTGNMYYKYRISTHVYGSNDICDIYAYVASPYSLASQICSIDDASTKPVSWETSYTNPFGNSGSETKKYSDAIIYEMHIRDWGMGLVTDSEGKFLDIASEDMVNHLKDIGVTHVQILPMFDYAVCNGYSYIAGERVDNEYELGDANYDKAYNWGYNPYHYNVPEGRYATTGYTDGADAVKEMRTMIKALHDAGISVIMDVVFNHTSGTGKGSLYDMTVPYYYYRLTEDGKYSNGSGCGNETDCDAPMFRSYMVESLKHWMKDYHINGFRFDLMGLHSKEAMKEIYEALYAIDKNVLVYGEPWTGGTSLVNNSMEGAVKTSSGYGVGAFDDDFRNSVKGAEFGGFKLGFVQNGSEIANLKNGLIGGSCTRNKTDIKGLAIHYIECHDNYTLFDKLSLSQNKVLSDDLTKCPYISYESMSAENKELIRSQDKLAGALVLLSQGTAFLNGGQEFMRTKLGNPDSYAADTKGNHQWSESELLQCNKIDLSYKTKYADVYNTYKGLIALRKANPNVFGNSSNASVSDSNGVVRYTTGDYCVFFNGTSSAAAISSSGYSKMVDVSSGTPSETTEIPSNVPAKSFVILKK